MDAARTLIRTVTRAFYDTRHVLVIDALLMHSVLWIDDLAFTLSMNTKDLRKLCSTLRQDKLISVHSRPEIREDQPHKRPQNKEYYFVNFHLAIDAIKLRIVRLEKKVRDLYKPAQERKEWFCLVCKAQWTEMEVLHKYSDRLGGFECARCGGVLDRREVSAADRAGSERSSRLMEQLDKLVGPSGLLRVIDSTDIPQNDFDQAFSRHKPVQRPSTNPGVKWTLVKDKQQSDTVHGVKMETPEVQVNFTTQEATEKAEAEKKRQRLEQQEKNILPAWHTDSTVTGQKTILGDQEEARIKTIKDSLGNGAVRDDTETKPVVDDNKYISEYYRELEEEKAKLAAQARDRGDGEYEDIEGEEEDDDDDDEDEDNFENVLTTGTPASLSSTSGIGSKRKADDSDVGSGPNTAMSTPAAIESPSKRARVEKGAADVESDEDDDDFEDAL